MSLLNKFNEFVKTENLFQANDTLLLAVSGGVDSVVLCELCKQSGFDFSIAHCNFLLRGNESEEDEIFVMQLAEKYKVPFFVKKFNTEKYASENKISIQHAARDLRYEWFAGLINESAAKTGLHEASQQTIDYLLTAHHADDNIETILMNFFKGSGINGIKGILPKHNRIIRPLLFAKKEDLLLFATEHKLAFREDSSNSSDHYTRNYFRNQLIPGLEKVFPQAKDNIIQNARRFREINILYDQAVEAVIKKLVTIKGNEIHIPVLKLLKTAALSTILYELMKDAGFSAQQTDEAVRLLKSESGKYMQSATHRILHNRNWLIISALNDTSTGHYLIEENEKEIIFTKGKLSISRSVDLNIVPNAEIALLDESHIKFPLLLRKWKQGDYFYPLGMRKKKKLSRFFIDRKLSMNEKENAWVIESGKKIIWIVGMRIDDRVKITPHTTRVLKLSLYP
jgi:tRNA(Ile)-lysidine synthase